MLDKIPEALALLVKLSPVVIALALAFALMS